MKFGPAVPEKKNRYHPNSTTSISQLSHLGNIFNKHVFPYKDSYRFFYTSQVCLKYIWKEANSS